MAPAPLASTSTSGNLIPPTNAFASLSINGPSAGAPFRSPKLKDRISSNLDGFTKKIKPKFPDYAVFVATMTGLPIIRDAIDGVQVMQDWTSCRERLVEFRQKLERLLAAIESHSHEPGYMSPTMVEFKANLEALLAQVQRDSSQRSASHFVRTTRLLEMSDEYERQGIALVEEAIIAGTFSRQTVALPEEYDKIIPTLKSLHKGNGLVQKSLVGMKRHDGGPVEHAPVENLHVMTHQGTYKDTPVEIREYFGGPEDELLQHLKELVRHYETFKDNANLPQLFGGSVDRLPDGKLCAYLVLSPTDGEPWVDVAKARQSVELLCQVAEQTMQAFDYFRIKNRSMNWETIKIRSDGTLLIVPSTQGGNSLLTENVWDPMDLPEDIPWPIQELFQFFQEADRQGITRDAIAVLRAHTGPWDKIAVWKAAKQIDLRPAEDQLPWFTYPPRDWQVHTGMIIAWEHGDTERFDQLDMMPRQGLTLHDRAHLRQFLMISAIGKREDGTIVSYWEDGSENWLKRTPDEEWEYFTLEPWENIEHVSLYYESSRLDIVPWDQWKIILESCAKRRNRELDDLAVVTRLEGGMSLYKRDCPELGTRPLYFFRKSDQTNTTPREFWGFFSFNPDPKGAPGINMRTSEQGMGRVMSDSVPAGPTSWVQSSFDIEFRIVWVNMKDDWDNKIRYELEQKRLNPFPMYELEHITWSDDDDETEDEYGWR